MPPTSEIVPCTVLQHPESEPPMVMSPAIPHHALWCPQPTSNLEQLGISRFSVSVC